MDLSEQEGAVREPLWGMRARWSAARVCTGQVVGLARVSSDWFSTPPPACLLLRWNLVAFHNLLCQALRVLCAL